VEAQKIIVEGRQIGEKLRAQMIEETHQQQQAMLERARREIEMEKESAIAELAARGYRARHRRSQQGHREESGRSIQSEDRGELSRLHPDYGDEARMNDATIGRNYAETLLILAKKNGKQEEWGTLIASIALAIAGRSDPPVARRSPGRSPAPCEVPAGW